MSELKEQRKNINITQEELSEKSGISLRTIQRIESGSIPKGYTLKALARALEIDENSLLETKPAQEPINSNQLNLINLSSLAVFCIPVINFLIPLFITLLKKQINPMTIQIISIQVFWTSIMAVIFLLGNLINLGDLGRDIFLVVLFLIIPINAFMVIRNSIEIKKNNKLYFSLNFTCI